MTSWLGPGFVIILGFILLGVKLPLKLNLWLLGHSLAIDIAVVALAYLLHWGTFTGVMAAAFAGLLCSGCTSVARWAIGYIERGQYKPGRWDLSDRLVNHG